MLASSRGFRKIPVDSDSLNAIKLLEGNCSNTHSCFSLTKQIHDVHSNEGELAWNHVLREANYVAVNTISLLSIIMMAKVEIKNI